MFPQLFLRSMGIAGAIVALLAVTLALVVLPAFLALLVPSLMELLGSVNWWAPAPLRRLHGRIGLREPPVSGLDRPEVDYAGGV